MSKNITRINRGYYSFFFRVFLFQIAFIAKAGRNAKSMAINSGKAFSFSAFIYIKDVNKIIDITIINIVAIVFLFFKDIID